MALVVVGVLVGSMALSYYIRAQPLQYDMQLDEFDPYFNYRATKYLYENGWESYLNWHDDLSWYPEGRDVSATSQNMLHLTAATLYTPFESVMTLYDFVIYFPAIIGSLTVIPMFLLVRFLTNTRIGLMAGFFFAVSIPFIQRGTAGWFKSEPLGLFYGIIALYLFVSTMKMMQTDDRFTGLIRFVLSGVVMAFAISSWGGGVFFLMPIVLWVVMLPFVYRKQFNLPSTLISLTTFVGSMYATSLLFDRANGLLSGFVVISFAIAGIFLLFNMILGKKKRWNYYKNLLLFSMIFVGIIAVGIVIESPLYAYSINDRYLSILIPGYTESPLTNSVAEHRIPSITHIFERTVFLLVFAPVGVFAVFRKTIPRDVAGFTILFSGLGLYIGSTIVRLELFMGFAMILLASIGLYYIFEKFRQQQSHVKKKRGDKYMGTLLILMLLTVTIFPAVLNWTIMMDRPPMISTGATYAGETNAWFDALDWMKNNTPEDAVILAWWDYGYWIETLGERTTVIDNAAFAEGKIRSYAQILTGDPDTAGEQLSELGVDYVAIYIDGVQHPESTSYAVLGGSGADIEKMGWILRIAERDTSLYFDGKNRLNTNFYDKTFFGKMVPFTPIVDSNPIDPTGFNPNVFPWQQNTINPETGELWEYGWSYFDNMKTESMPKIRLAYATDEFINIPLDMNGQKRFRAVLIYEVMD